MILTSHAILENLKIRKFFTSRSQIPSFISPSVDVLQNDPPILPYRNDLRSDM